MDWQQLAYAIGIPFCLYAISMDRLAYIWRWADVPTIALTIMSIILAVIGAPQLGSLEWPIIALALGLGALQLHKAAVRQRKESAERLAVDAHTVMVDIDEIAEDVSKADQEFLLKEIFAKFPEQFGEIDMAGEVSKRRAVYDKAIRQFQARPGDALIRMLPRFSDHGVSVATINSLLDQEPAEAIHIGRIGQEVRSMIRALPLQ